jgi:hypothetical protein
LRRRAFALISVMPIPGVSSMNIGDSESSANALMMRCHSSLPMRPVRRRWASTRASEQSRREKSCWCDISSENTPIVRPRRSAACAAMLSAKVVFPIEGRAASTTRSEGWSPAVHSSSWTKPVGIPVIGSRRWVRSSMILIERSPTVFIERNPVLRRSSETWKIARSASSRTSSAEPCGRIALVRMAWAERISSRRIDFSFTMRA